MCEEVITKKTVLIDSIDRVKAFVNVMNKSPFVAEIHTGRYVVDAKSIMGVFSLDISKPVTLAIHGSAEEVNELVSELEENKFIIA